MQILYGTAAVNVKSYLTATEFIGKADTDAEKSKDMSQKTCLLCQVLDCNGLLQRHRQLLERKSKFLLQKIRTAAGECHSFFVGECCEKSSSLRTE